jgi:hypothetical protein
VTHGRDGTARVLVATRDLVGAGLLGALVDGMGSTALFPVRGESVEAAIKRLAPDCIVIEASHPAARAAETYDMAAAAGVGVIVFAPSRPWGAVEDMVDDRPGVTLVWPRDGESLAARLEFALGAACARALA